MLIRCTESNFLKIEGVHTYITKPIEHVVLRSQFYYTLLQSNSWDFYQDTKEGKVKKKKRHIILSGWIFFQSLEIFT